MRNVSYMRDVAFVVLLMLLALASMTAASAQDSSAWQITIESSFDRYHDTFIAGVSSRATDSYEVQADVLKPPLPPGTAIQIFTNVEEKTLTKDIRALLNKNIPKKWEITLTAVGYAGNSMTGSNMLSWDISKVSSSITLKLIDYREDSERTIIAETIDLRQQSSYAFNLSNALGTYRYLDLVAESRETSEEPEEIPAEEDNPPSNSPPPPFQSSSPSSSSSSSSHSSRNSSIQSSPLLSAQLLNNTLNTEGESAPIKLSKPAPITGAGTSDNSSYFSIAFILLLTSSVLLALLILLIILHRRRMKNYGW